MLLLARCDTQATAMCVALRVSRHQLCLARLGLAAVVYWSYSVNDPFARHVIGPGQHIYKLVGAKPSVQVERPLQQPCNGQDKKSYSVTVVKLPASCEYSEKPSTHKVTLASPVGQRSLTMAG